MSVFRSRPFAGESDLRLLVAFAQDATAARWPRSTYWHAGDIVWQAFDLVRHETVEDIYLWFDRDALAGFVLFEPPLTFEFDVRPGVALDGPLLAQMLTWAESHRRQLLDVGDGDVPRAYGMFGQGTVATTALESDGERIAALEHRGYASVERHSICYARSLDRSIPGSRLPENMHVRHASDADLEERVDLHRDAWSVWGSSNATVDNYRRLRAAPVYDQELDVVVEGERGNLVSYCICWVDPRNGVATFEPVGTRPGFTGRGLAREAIFEALRRLRARGVHTALVGTASINERALRLYPSCGFEVVDRRRYYVKQIADNGDSSR